MTIQEFKKTARLLKELYKDLESDALADGVDIFSEEYKTAQTRLRESVLAKLGFTIEEYREAKELVAPAKKVDVAKQVLEASTIAVDASKRLEALVIPNEENILAKAKEIAESVVRAPVIQNNIVERTTKVVEKPTIVHTTVKETVHEEYNDAEIRAEIGYVMDALENLPKPQPTVDVDAKLAELKSEFLEKIEKNINTLDMPDFRKLAMGLQAQIDEVRATGSGASAFTDLTDAPSTYASQAGKGVRVSATEDGLEFFTLGGGTGTVTDVSVVTANGVSGSVATSTTTPAITLTLGAITPSSVTTAGDIEVTTTTTGIILKSADGTRWRIGITDTGQLTATNLP